MNNTAWTMGVTGLALFLFVTATSGNEGVRMVERKAIRGMEDARPPKNEQALISPESPSDAPAVVPLSGMPDGMPSAPGVGAKPPDGIAPLAPHIPVRARRTDIAPLRLTEQDEPEVPATTLTAPGVNPAVRDRVRAAIGAEMSEERIKRALERGVADEESRRILEQARQAARPVLLEERAARRGLAPQAVEPTAATAAGLQREPPRKMELKPLDAAKGAAPEACEREGRIREIEREVATETEPHMRERRLLVLAANHVGQGNYGAAKQIYDELAATSDDPGVLHAVGRNLRVVDQNIAIIDERNPVQRERLELDLARLHRDLGHDKAARELSRRLAGQATQPDIRAAAKSILADGIEVNPERHLEFLRSRRPPGTGGDGKTGPARDPEGGAQ